MALAKRLTAGVDVWINTPRRPWEASGTSGMKVLVNGGLNLSELDGWWARPTPPKWDGRWGTVWNTATIRVGCGRGNQRYTTAGTRDDSGILYPRRASIPTGWVARMRESMARLTPRFSTNRAVEEYTLQHYLPAASAYLDRAVDNGQIVVAIVNWHDALEQKWPALRFGEVKVERGHERHVFQAQVYLDDLDPEAVRVELYADGADGAATGASEIERVRPMVGATNGYLYRAAVPRRPPSDGLHGAIDTASRPGGGSTGRLPHPLAEVIRFVR